MKKKQIEHMPAAHVLSRMNGTVGIARMPVEGVCTVDYINTETKEVYVRVCLTKKEFMNYYPDTGKWDKRNLETLEDQLIGVANLELRNATIYRKNYLEKVIGKIEVAQHQKNLSYEARKKATDYRREKLKERCVNMPELTPDMEKFLKSYIGPMHFLYYRRKGKKVNFTCSNCGETREYKTEVERFEDIPITYFGDTPRHNDYIQCPMCGVNVKCKAEGRAKGVQMKKDSKYIIQPYGNDDVVVRYFEIRKSISGCVGHAEEDMQVVEVARTFFLKNRVQRDYQKYDPYTERTFWDDCNLAGIANIILHAGKNYKGNLDELANTRFKYSELTRQIWKNDYTDAANYLEAYMKYPEIEMLQKFGMTKMVNYLLDNHRWCDLLINREGKNLLEVFGITKQRWNDLRINNGDEDMLRIYQIEKREGLQFSDGQITFLCTVGANAEKLNTVLKYAKIQKLINYIIKQSGADEKAIGSCLGATNKIKIKGTFAEYCDYVRMCEENERNLNNPHKIYPQDIHAAHNRELLLKDKRKNEIEVRNKNKNNPNIKKDAAEYNRRYRYRNNQYIIRAPKDAGEIYMEGLLLDHCVGRAGYIEAMNRHETVILFLRRKEKPNEPYYTLEIKKDSINQAYGKGDTKPDWEEVEPFLEKFKQERLKKKAERKVG